VNRDDDEALRRAAAQLDLLAQRIGDGAATERDRTAPPEASGVVMDASGAVIDAARRAAAAAAACAAGADAPTTAAAADLVRAIALAMHIAAWHGAAPTKATGAELDLAAALIDAAAKRLERAAGGAAAGAASAAGAVGVVLAVLRSTAGVRTTRERMVRPHVRLATAALLRAAHAAVRGDREAAERAAAAAADAAAMAVRALVGVHTAAAAEWHLAQALLALAQLALAVAHDDNENEPGDDLVRLAALEAQAFRALARGYAHGADAAHAQALAVARRRLDRAQQARANAGPDMDMMGVAARRSYRRAATAAAVRAIDGALPHVHRW
jgi:hypothetical protein